ncbi:COG0535 Predicted Fe-S oxidoreductases [uncultured Caudovirales phage]|uniref:COG0535 Predicted Fe-S oxidoreductases n=1 Tax=uncultured Caudovirales phage TaxID=2100421 RepID=A0A6J5LKW4_9CAUD|nr:COG0535 Predicted Fe-S oxidoreductases [uncultured Caudovirales phage]
MEIVSPINGKRKLNLFNFDLIDEYQLEITTYCNAACPQCPRNIQGSGINPYMPLVHLNRSVINDTFSESHCKNIRQIFFCGSYGDPIMHPEFLDILRDFRRKNPTIWLYIHTNGGVHSEEYWSEIAKIMNGYGQIDFGFDGLEDTLHLYRRNVKYSVAMSNARAFIDAGGRAQWNFIVFKHNEHQVELARQLSKDYGFFNFLPRKTGRFYDHSDESEFNKWPVMDKTGAVEYYLEPPVNLEFRNPSTQKIEVLKNLHGSFSEYLKNTPIKCDALVGKKVAINAEGLVLPCNFFNHNLYDARFHTNALPFRHYLHSFDGKNQIQEFVDDFKHELSIINNSLDQVFKSKFWTQLINSWSQKNRIMECAMTCGEKFTKVWDQGGSIR